MKANEIYLDPEKWHEETIEAAQAVVDGLFVARRILEAAGDRGRKGHPYAREDHKLLLSIYDRYQQELRIPVIVRPPDDEEGEGEYVLEPQVPPQQS